MKGKDIMEIWKDIVGYEGLYEVSSFGNVRSVDRTVFCNGKGGYTRKLKGQMIKIQKGNNGYLSVVLSKDGKIKRYLVHRLVAEAFIPNPEGKETVNHKDEDRYNNCVDNLEWMTKQDNCNYGTRNIRVGQKQGKPVECIETGEVFFSGVEAQRQTGIHCNQINGVCNGRKSYYTAGGYHWKFVED